MCAARSDIQIAPKWSPPVPKPQWAHSIPQSWMYHAGQLHFRQTKPLIRVGCVPSTIPFAVVVVVIFSLPFVLFLLPLWALYIHRHPTI